MRGCRFLLYAFTNALLVSAASHSGSLRKRAVDPRFVSTSGGEFQVNGSVFQFIGTNAYWLPTLNSVQDINNTLASIAAAGIKVVRTWAFNDVDTIPENGTWFQLIANGTTTINNGTNGFQRLDTVIELAEQHGLFVLLSLTNNWNPRPLIDNLTNLTSAADSSLARRDVTSGTNNSLPRNFLSNDYGGIDAYVREFGVQRTHDEFFSNTTIINIFQNYTTQVVTRYVNSPSVFAWELANDPRCNSSLPASPSCNTQTITQWHSTVAQHIASIDPNHLIASGNQGFFCATCQKLFTPTKAPPPQTSASPSSRRRSARGLLSESWLLRKRIESRKKSRDLAVRSGGIPTDGVRIRGRWASTPTRRQDDTGVGSPFDGSFGIDSEDISNIPQIGYNSFSLFPDQNIYGPPDPNLPAFNNTVQTGLDWIQRHVESAATSGKPSALIGFGLVTQNNAPDFVPFNTTIAPFGTTTPLVVNASSPGVTDAQRNDAYTQWIGAGIASGLNGMIQYQWGQVNLTESTGTSVSANTTGISPEVVGNTESPVANSTGQSPNDGYTIAGIGEDGAQQVISNAAQQIVPNGP